MSMKNSSDTIGNRTRCLRACSSVLPPAAPTHAPPDYVSSTLNTHVHINKSLGSVQLSLFVTTPSHHTSTLLNPSLSR